MEPEQTPNKVKKLEAEKVRWFYKRGETWHPLCGRDSLLIEGAVKEFMEEGRSAAFKLVLVLRFNYKLWINDEDAYVLKPVVLKGTSSLPLLRAEWFFVSANGDWLPVDSMDIVGSLGCKIEKKHLQLFGDAAVIKSKRNGNVIDRLSIKISPSEKISITWLGIDNVEMLRSSRSSQYRWYQWQRWFRKPQQPTKIYRGFNQPALAEDAPPPIKHLVFVVHGIGQKRWPNIITNTESVTQLSERLYREFPDSFPQSIDGVLFLPVEWRHDLNISEDLLSGQLSPDGILEFRDLVNETVVDAAYHMTPGNAAKIQRKIIEEMNKLYAQVLGRDPGFKTRDGPSISIFGHSLGSVASYDILKIQQEETSPKLNFKVDRLFVVGSPLGAILSLRHPTEKNQLTNLPFRVYNIIDKCDMVCYLLEPLSGVSDSEPTVIKKYDSYPPTPNNVTDSTLTMNREQPTTSGIKGKRLDFVLQTSTILGEYIAAISAHTDYWENVDVVMFVLKVLEGDQSL